MDERSQLHGILTQRLAGLPLIVASNREPFIHDRVDGRIVCREPAGGVTAALHPLLTACGGVWVAHGSGAADAEVCDWDSTVMVPPDRPSYALRRVWIPEKLRRAYYDGLANGALWPLCHNVFRRPRFSATEWESYRKVNEIFASAVLEQAAGGPALVFLQDYHLGLVPRLLRKRNPKLAIAHFWHIPWPDPDVFAALPWGRELLDGLLASDLLGFHLARYCANFRRCVERTGGAVMDSEGRVFSRSNATAVRAFPIGIDFDAHCRTAESPAAAAALAAWKRRIGPGVRVGLGIDRVDYTKGIPERLRGLDLFFEQCPEWRGKLVFVQVGVPSRGGVSEYACLASEVAGLVAAINERWGTPDWRPVIFVNESLPREQMIALHRLADFCLVTPLHDGMNLVAKEFVASRADLDGVLVLSRMAGAAVELGAALLVNPFSEEEIAGSIASALSLGREERRARMTRLRAAVERNDVHRWAAAILGATADAAGWKAEPALPVAPPRAVAAGVAEAAWS